MKKLLFLFLLIPFIGSTQSIGYFRFDTSYFYKVGGNNELKIHNSTRDTLGFLYNYSNGRTRFERPRAVPGGIKFGLDTVLVGSSTQTLQDVFDVESKSPVMNGNNEIDGGGGHFGWTNLDDWYVDLNTNEFAIQGQGGGGGSTFIIAGDGSHDLRIGTGLTTGRRTQIIFIPDSIRYLPFLGRMNIDTLEQRHGSDTTRFKPMVWNSVSGEWEAMTYWPGGGGSSGITVDVTTITGGTDGRLLYDNGGTVGETDEMRWDDVNDRLGVGSATPEAKLTVRGTAGLPSAALLQNTTDNVDFAFYPASIGVVYGILSGKDHIFATYGSPSNLSGFTELGRFNTNGEFIVGTTDNGAFQLQVNGVSYFSGQTQYELQLKIKEISAPSTPSSGYGVIYAKSDGLPYWKDDAGTEFPLTGGYTFNSGLTETAGTVRLGGTLLASATIATGANTLTISTSTAAVTPLNVTSTTGYAAEISSTTATSLRVINTGAAQALSVIKNATATNTLISTLSIERHVSGGSGAIGAGGSLDFYVEVDDGSLPNVARIAAVLTNAAAGAYGSKLDFYTTTGTSEAVRLTLDQNGSLILTGRMQKDQGADVASVAGAISLGLDGNVFEITGTNAITLISNTSWQNGSEVTLLFTSSASLTDGVANSGTDIGLELAGNINFTGSAGALLTLTLSEIGGTQRWREKSRSVN